MLVDKSASRSNESMPNKKKSYYRLRNEPTLSVIVQYLIILLSLATIISVQAFVTSAPHSSCFLPRNGARVHQLEAVTKKQTAVIDGSELSTLETYFLSQKQQLQPQGGNVGNAIDGSSSTKRNKKSWASSVGYCTVVAGTIEQKSHDRNGERVVGIALSPMETAHINTEDADSERVTILDKNTKIYTESMATIPIQISDADAIATLASSIVGVHCAFTPTCTTVEGVGGSTDSFGASIFKDDGVKPTVVVVGGSEHACFLSDALSTLGANVTQITTTPLLRPRKKAPSVNILPPAVGKLQLGFASILGQFDALVDTITDEAKVGESVVFDSNINDYDGDDEEDGDDDGETSDWDYLSDAAKENVASAVVNELKKQHGCDRYLSTFTQCQKIVRDDGLVFGRKTADEYMDEITSCITQIETSPSKMLSFKRQYKYIIPPINFGQGTLQKLLDAGMISPFNKKNNHKNILVRTWSLKDFWELTSWPRDSTGGANVRFGLPVIEDLESLYDDGNTRNNLNGDASVNGMISAPPKLSDSKFAPPGIPKDEFAEKGIKNPFVIEIQGVDELDEQVLSSKKDCLLFLSAPFCRTCRYLTPQYTRFARLGKEKNNYDVVFAKADISGKVGKQLSRALDVNAVPTFVMFRDGKVYGDKLSVSRLPSKKLNLAVEYLTSGVEWDGAAFSKQTEKKTKK